MLLDDDVMADGETKAGALSGWLGREERVEHLVLHILCNASTVIADRDFHAITKVFGRGRKDGLVISTVCFVPALGCRIKAI